MSSPNQPQVPLPKPPPTNRCVEVGKFGLEGEIEQLKRDKNVLMLELVKLRQQQQSTDQELMRMGQRLQLTEQRQQQMMSFLAKAMHNPAFISQLMQQTESSKQFGDARKKRRLPGQGEKEQEDEEEEQEESIDDHPTNRQLVKYNESSNHRDTSPSSAAASAAGFLDLTDSDNAGNKYEVHLDDYVKEILGPSFFDHIPDTTVTQQQMQMKATLTEYFDVPPLLSLPHDMSENMMIRGAMKTDPEVMAFPSFSLEEDTSFDLDSNHNEYGGSFTHGLPPNSDLMNLDPGLANGSTLWDFGLDNSVNDDGKPQDASLLNLDDAREIDQLVEEMGHLDHHGKI